MDMAIIRQIIGKMQNQVQDLYEISDYGSTNSGDKWATMDSQLIDARSTIMRVAEELRRHRARVGGRKTKKKSRKNNKNKSLKRKIY